MANTYLSTQCAAVIAQFSFNNAAPHLCRYVCDRHWRNEICKKIRHVRKSIAVYRVVRWSIYALSLIRNKMIVVIDVRKTIIMITSSSYISKIIYCCNCVRWGSNEANSGEFWFVTISERLNFIKFYYISFLLDLLNYILNTNYLQVIILFGLKCVMKTSIPKELDNWTLMFKQSV